MPAKVIAVTCLKGGVGKTTTTASLGGLMARDSKVLLIDLDSQENLTNTFTDGGFDDTIYEAFKRRRGLPVYEVRENLDLVPSCTQVCGLDSEFMSKIGCQEILRRLVAEVRDSYDWILMDCPTHFGIAMANALIAADAMLVPITCDTYSADSIRKVLGLYEETKAVNQNLTMAGMFLNRFHSRRVMDRVVDDALRENWNEYVLSTRIRENSAIGKAPLYKKDIWTYMKTSSGALDYECLLNELKQRI